MFDPSLRDAIGQVGPERALAIFEQGVGKLRERLFLLDYLLNSNAAFYTLEELRGLTEGFSQYLEHNRESLSLTGEPESLFISRRFPFMELRNLYYVKLSSRWSLAQDRQGRPPNLHRTTVFDFPWEELGLNREWRDANGRSCSYEEADLFTDLDPRDADLLASGRAALFDLKKRVLSELSNALKDGSIKGLWENCLRLITSTITAEEAMFYLRMDRWYSGYDVRTGEVADEDAGLMPGGLSALLEVIGDYEKEISIGTMSRTKQELAHLGMRFPPDEVSLLWRKSHSALDCYFEAAAGGERQEIDRILEQFDDREDQEQLFWNEYRHRVAVALENEFFTDVVVRTRVRQRHVVSFEPTVRTFFEWANAHLEFTGEMPSLSVSEPNAQVAAARNEFRREGQYWTIIFDGSLPMHLRDSKGINYVAHLLANPGREVHAIELAQIDSGSATTPVGRANFEDEGLHVSHLGDAGEILDERAKTEYKARLNELEEEIADAESNNDPERLSQAIEQRDALTQQLTSAFGIGGRSRNAADPGERARKAVSGAITRSLKIFRREHTTLWHHVDSSLSMGIFFSYCPEHPVSWKL